MPQLKRKMYLLLPLALLVLSLTLAACGEQSAAVTDKNYTVPTYQGTTSLDDLASDTTFTAALLKDNNNASFPNPKMKVYATNSALSDTQNWYRNEMTKLGWSDRTQEILKATTLGSNGWVLGFVKDQQVVSVIMIGTGARNDGILKGYTSILPADKNILVVLEAGYKAVAK
ncbi:MAG: hypothetical protein HXX08_06560 [Chloroflexi bacterium]|uniref:Uncharacterized protein n=1 Tax=Candidatus Chlorohelix allophototropha TaxID=3003348 RepID=A0A8T7M1I0_9CHLR|nr:hypothetical protein [Chloroflexota bacterium]WJW67394.1 hypothetical protein OZ401_000660 [Chloroflexota bacterium L227-S17]